MHHQVYLVQRPGPTFLSFLGGKTTLLLEWHQTGLGQRFEDILLAFPIRSNGCILIESIIPSYCQDRNKSSQQSWKLTRKLMITLLVPVVVDGRPHHSK